MRRLGSAEELSQRSKSLVASSSQPNTALIPWIAQPPPSVHEVAVALRTVAKSSYQVSPLQSTCCPAHAASDLPALMRIGLPLVRSVTTWPKHALRASLGHGSCPSTNPSLSVS